ncbi:MAG: methionine--tRNA ligase [Polyangiaceae bacterium]|nr:methionine--tRNA ligase [Polyangiaceae bacterium]
MSRFYVTTPIYYVNDVPHLGTSYTTVAADALRRYHRLRGDVTRMLTGTDEHGLKLEREARERGIPTADFVREMSDRFEAAWPKLEVEPDDFIRTTQPRHEARVQWLWEEIRRRHPEDLYLGAYEGWYCVPCEELKTEKELEPGNVCPIHKRPVERIKEESYFFRLSGYGQALLDHYAKHPEFVLPESRRNEVVSFVESGLRDLSVSRTSFRWGIPVPEDPKHVIWVWFDALPNYWTALQEREDTKPFWDGDGAVVHLVGKDILRFHAVYWPAILMSAGLRLPTTVFAHGFLTFNGQKMSKTLRNAVDPIGMARAFGDATRAGEAGGADVLRYQLLRGIAFGQDGDFDLAAMVERYNADLGKNLGNLLSRVLGLCSKMTEGKVPAIDAGATTPLETGLAEAAARHLDAARSSWSRLEPHRALEETLALCTAANVYVDRAAPWAEAKKGGPKRVETILGTLLSVLEAVSVMIWPVLPSRSDEMRRQLGLAPVAPRAGVDQWPSGLRTRAPGEALAPALPLFPMLDADTGQKLIGALTPQAARPEQGEDASRPEAPAASPPPVAPAAPAPIDYEAFSAVDLRVGVVRACERVPKKDKLLRLSVDLGEASPRTIIAGLALSFSPEAIVGRKVVVVANLAPRDFGKGLVSHGMVLATGPSDHLTLATVDGDVPPGARLK